MSSGGGEWLTWEQAAALVGCPVPTIDWYTRNGRIEHRPRGFAMPTLRRSSVEEFAVWWHDQQAVREQRMADRLAGVPIPRRRRRRDGTLGPVRTPAPRLSGPDGWLTGQEAATRLGVSVGHVRWLRSHSHIGGTQVSLRWWYDPDSVAAYSVEEARWVSLVDAAELVGCSTGVLVLAADRGEIVRRSRGRAYASYERASVETFGRLRRDQAQEAAASRAERTRERSLAERPDLDHEWLTAEETGALLGVSRVRVGQLASEERLPYTRVGRRIWFRRDHIEQLVQARRFATRHSRPA